MIFLSCISKEFFSLSKYLKISNLVWIGMRHLKTALTCPIDIVISYIWLQINFCSYVGITYNHPVIHKQGFFSLIKYLKISNLVWIGMHHLKNSSNLSMDIVIPYIWLQINFCSYVGITYNHRVNHKQGFFP